MANGIQFGAYMGPTNHLQLDQMLRSFQGRCHYLPERLGGYSITTPIGETHRAILYQLVTVERPVLLYYMSNKKRGCHGFHYTP